MRQQRFPVIPRFFAVGPSRRDVLRGLSGAGLGLVALHPLGAVLAKKKRKQKGKKPELQRNEFGCVDVGGKCLGNDSNCCSGICEGKKPKKGEKDKRTCVGHNVGGCTPQRSFCFADPIQLSLCNPAGDSSVCFPTTGKAGFCGNFAGFKDDENCQLCTKDVDCEMAGFPPGSACVILDPEGINCVDVCTATENRACLRPGI